MLSLVAEGELAALEILYDRYRAMAYGIALRITEDAGLAEDAVQDAFLGAWRNAGRYAPERGAVKTWLLSIVHHRAIDLVRRRRASARLPEAEEPPPAVLIVPDVWPAVAGHLDAEAVRAALARLPDIQRQAIELAYWAGLTQAEIAQRTEAPLGTVKSRVRLGLLALRRELGGTTAGDGDPGSPSAAARRPAPASGPGPDPGEPRRAGLGGEEKGLDVRGTLGLAVLAGRTILLGMTMLTRAARSRGVI